MHDSKEFLESYKLRIENSLKEILFVNNPNKLQEAMSYSVLGGGKRLRPCLTYIASEIGPKKVPPKTVDNVAASVEFIHCYSLIHDDLPAMDDDSLRRGNPTCHKVFGEDIAILAGDALQTLSCSIIMEEKKLEDHEKVAIIKVITRACGWNGMVEGQLIDISNDHSLDEKELDQMHIKKTGELIKASLITGSLISGLNSEQIKLISNFGEKIGLAFQIIDDLLDVDKDSKSGKERNSDLRNGRITYPSLLGVEKSRKKALALRQEAKEILSNLNTRVEKLSLVADFVVERNS
ncbi:MAG: polyprenyl synthetase family protein [Gammaproteobacteria bacterium]